MPDRIRSAVSSPSFPPVLLLLGWALAALGYWSSWVWAAPAGLRVPGIDLAEYVKFVAEVRSGQIRLTREVFLLPLVVLSLSMSLLAHRRELRLPGALRWLANLLAIPIALSMLPPAWTPGLLTTPEFVKQTAAIVLCLVAALLAYPVLRRLPLTVAVIVGAGLALLGAALPLFTFVRLYPAFAPIYGRPATLGGGPLLLAVGMALIATAPLLLLRRRNQSDRKLD